MKHSLIMYVIAPFLLVAGLFGLTGLLVGEIGWFSAGAAAMIAALYLIEHTMWAYRIEHYPEHAITSEWDDERADTVYSYEYYGRRVSEGGRLWARDIAEHYGIKMPEERSR